VLDDPEAPLDPLAPPSWTFGCGSEPLEQAKTGVPMKSAATKSRGQRRISLV
jgi:hypothetical protein